MHIHTYVLTHRHTCTHQYMCTYICMEPCTYTHMNIYVHTYTYISMNICKCSACLLKPIFTCAHMCHMYTDTLYHTHRSLYMNRISLFPHICSLLFPDSFLLFHYIIHTILGKDTMRRESLFSFMN